MTPFQSKCPLVITEPALIAPIETVRIKSNEQVPLNYPTQKLMISIVLSTPTTSSVMISQIPDLGEVSS